jgi:AcrR family transcriptional regulator
MSKSRQKSLVTVDRILEAAGRVIQRNGSAGLTIDAVAAEAEVSKGGVLHHFASKDALIAAMVAHQLGRMQAVLAELEARLEPGAATPLRAAIEHARSDYLKPGFPPALLAASVQTPAALDGYRSVLRETVQRLEREPGRPNEAVVLFFALLGLFLTKGLGFHVFDEQQKNLFLDVAAGMVARLGQNDAAASP